MNSIYLATLECLDISSCRVELNPMISESIPHGNYDYPMLKSESVPAQCVENVEQRDSAMEIFAFDIQQQRPEVARLEGVNDTNFSACDMELDVSAKNMNDDRQIAMETQMTSDTNFTMNREANTELSSSSIIGNTFVSHMLQLDLSHIPAIETDISGISQNPSALSNITIRDSTAMWIGTTTNNKYEAIRQIVEDLKGSSTVHIYGSHLYNLSDVHSDLNLYVDVYSNQYYNEVGKSDMERNKNILVNALKRSPFDWVNVICDQRIGSIPVVNAVSATYGINCTFSFGNGTCVEANKLLMEYIKVQPMSMCNSYRRSQTKYVIATCELITP